MKTIQYCLFYGCSNLETIEIPDNLESIGALSFGSCSKLRDLTLPKAVTNIVGSAFEGCKNINLKIDANNKVFIVDSNIIYKDGGATLVLALPNSITSSTYTIPSNVTNVLEGAFCMIPCIREVVMSATYMGSIDGMVGPEGRGIPGINKITVAPDNSKYSSIDGSLYDKSGKKLISYLSTGTIATIPEGVEELARYSFTMFRSMTDIKLPSSLKTIQRSTFYACLKFKKLDIGKSVTTIAPAALAYTGLTDVTISAENPNYVSENGFVMDKAKKNLIAYVGTSDNVEIPNTIETIVDSALSLKSMKTIKIPNGLKTIGPSAVESCHGLTTLDIPNSVTSISYAFANCSNLTKINIDNTKGKISGSPWGNPYGEKAIHWLR